MYDVLIRNGHIIDGTGNPRFKADVAVIGEKVVKIGSSLREEAKRVIDAEGLIVCPGFIDVHGHSDFTLLANPKAESKIRQGITTEVVGNCGGSAAPVKGPALKKARDSARKYGLEVDWSTMGEYLGRLERQGVALNVGALIGHGTVRACVLGYENRHPTGEKLEEMKRLVAESMEQGAIGMSSGLPYAPGCYADTGELIELCKIVKEHGGIYTSHIRGEGADRLLRAVKEAIQICEEARVPVEISHFKALGKAAWGMVKETLRMVDEARKGGLDVTFDQYPYTGSSTGFNVLVPEWARAGGRQKLRERLKDPKTRKKIVEDAMRRLGKRGGPDKVVISSFRNNEALAGKNICEIAESFHMSIQDTLLRLMESKGPVKIVNLDVMSEEDVRTVMRHPAMMVGSDGYSLVPYGVLGEGQPHPRSYGTFPRILGKYVREERILTLSDAIRRMTSMPARKFGFWDRGLIKKGMIADITIFDGKSVADQATYLEPHRYATGIQYVLVNGQITLEAGEHTGKLAGKPLKTARANA